MLVMAGRRKYDEGCAVSHALDLIGERWALLIVRELLLGPKRFTDLRAGVPGASPDVLAQRLRELKDAGVVRQRKLPAGGLSRVRAHRLGRRARTDRHPARPLGQPLAVAAP